MQSTELRNVLGKLLQEVVLCWWEMFKPYDVTHMGFLVEMCVLLLVINLITSQTPCRSEM